MLQQLQLKVNKGMVLPDIEPRDGDSDEKDDHSAKADDDVSCVICNLNRLSQIFAILWNH